MNCHVQFQSANPLLIVLCSLPWPLRPWMHCLCCLSLLSLCWLSLFSLDLGLCHGFLLSLRPCVGLPSDLLRRGGLLLKSGGPLFHLLRPGGLQSCLLRPGGLQSRSLSPGGLQFPRLCPGFPLCLGPRPLHFHVDLALRPSPCSASAPPPSWIVLERLEAAPWGGGGYVTNPGHELLFTHHKRSLTHHMDYCTTLTVERHLRLHFP